MLKVEGPQDVSRWADHRVDLIWQPEFKFWLERSLWLDVMRAQRDLGVRAVRWVAIRSYQRIVSLGPAGVNLDRIRQREYRTQHDVKARLEEFNALAGFQVAHLGMTGRDLDDNVELYQQKASLERIAQKLGRRGQEAAALDVNRLADRVPFRGIVGAVGTGQDQLDLLNGDTAKFQELNERVAARLGFKKGQQLDSVGQVYPRSRDFETASSLTATLSGAMPRPQGPWPVLMRGYVAMLAEIAGDQWAEGDVSCSSVRRVALPSLFLAASAWINDNAQE